MKKNKTVTCADCGSRTSGNFCQNCGASLGGRVCRGCGVEVSGRGKFCDQCGEPLEAGAAGRGGGAAHPRKPATASVGGGSDIAWWIAGATMVVLMLVLVWNGTEGSAPAAVPAPVSAFPTSIAQMTPRQTADEFFNRVMTASDNGDQLTVDQFLPTALKAYEAARPLDMDGLFHVSLLYYAGKDYEASLAGAREILAAEPGHVLGLVAAAKAALALGRDDEAAGYYQLIIENHDREIARPLPEYQTHARYFGVARDEARTFLAER